MSEQASPGPWDYYRNWLDGEGDGRRLTVLGREFPSNTGPDHDELCVLFEGYQDALINMALMGRPGHERGDNNLALKHALAEAQRYLYIGDIEVDVQGAQLVSLLGAIGLLRLDDFVAAIERAENPIALVLAWDRVCDAHGEAVRAYTEETGLTEKQARRRLAQAGAYAMHQRRYGEVRTFVREAWLEWQSKASRYASTAQFARDMIDKFPQRLTSPTTVERWVRQWREEAEGK